MSGYDIFKRAMTLLGYTDNNGDVPSGDGLLNRALDIINQIGLDVGNFQIIENLNDDIKADLRTIDAICYGTAMLLSLSDGDGGKNVLFCSFYNAKRAAAKSEIAALKDVLPYDDGGVD